MLPNVLLPSMLKTAAGGRPDSGGRKIVGAAGRLVPLKGFLSLVPMLRRLLDKGLDVEVRLAGTGPEGPAIRALAEKYNVSDRFVFLGSVGEMSEFYRTLDVFVVPSIREPFGLVALEASAHGLPVIGSDVDGIPEALSEVVGSDVVRPTVPMSDYAQMGSSLRGVPTRVYDPAGDFLTAPRAIDGAELADRVETLLTAGVVVPPMHPSVAASRFFAYADTLKGLLSR
ncbi:glycosyltransferase [Thioalkalivibrio sp. K90mix]|uniref:glycosyltransferase n=1 Tax=Thioalkalivibrio sp. (strain K90mix) TaxID=396595 RepID=UPI001FCAA953|nr:glycosyltransferase [Thioalkalivibrio sp. K90mix]